MRWVFVLIIMLLITPAYAGVISIVIDDLGYSEYQGNAAIDLPANVTLSVLPTTPFAESLIQKAILDGHEVMLHLPMQANTQAPLEHNTLTNQMLESELKQHLTTLLQQYPDISGVNNHMGSSLTSNIEPMQWLMQTLAEHQSLFFVDSRTSIHTVAQQQAQAFGIPNTRRDIFLDNQPNNPDAIREQLAALKRQAQKNGFALAIGHPHPQTLRILQQELPLLSAEGFELVPVSEYIARQR